MFEGWESCLRTERGEWLIKATEQRQSGLFPHAHLRHPTSLYPVQQAGCFGFPQNVLYSGNTEHIPIRAGCLHPAVSCYKPAAKPHPVMLHTHIALFPQSSAAFHELLKFCFLSVAKQQSSSLKKKKIPTEFLCELIVFFWVQMETASVGKLAEIFSNTEGNFSFVDFWKIHKNYRNLPFFPLRIILIIFYQF